MGETATSGGRCSVDCVTARNLDSISSVAEISDPCTSCGLFLSDVETFLNKMSEIVESGQFI